MPTPVIVEYFAHNAPTCVVGTTHASQLVYFMELQAHKYAPSMYT